ncbi:MAG: hypothetical protein ABGX12_03130, partial [Desulfurobacteriaceae bacterium]
AFNYDDDEVDGDVFSYTQDEYSRGYIGKPHKFNWKKSGVLDTDCFLCHADPGAGKEVVSPNGWSANNPTPANPRVFVFEKKDKNGNVVEISLGFPPQLTDEEKTQGYTIDSAAFYSNPLERIVAGYYSNVVQECMNNSGVDLSDAQKRKLVQTFTIAEITSNLKKGITKGFTIPYSKIGGSDYTYNGTGLSKFFDTYYIDPGAPNFSARDYLRNAFYESTADKEGQPYVGAGMFLRVGQLNIEKGGIVYNPMDTESPPAFVTLGRAGFFFGWADTGSLMGVSLSGKKDMPVAFVKLVKQSDGTFKAKAYYASTTVSLPVLKTSGKYSLCEPSNSSEKGVEKLSEGEKDTELTRMCAQCHFAMPDGKNKWTDPGGASHPSWYVRRGIIGMGADVVKRGAVFSRESENDNSIAPIAMKPNGEVANPNMDTEGIPIGYDVHFDKDKGNLSCLSCHGQDNLNEEERENHNPHNFLKGNDPAGEVMPALDYNPSPQTCLKCHWGSEREAAQHHRDKFGDGAEIHIAKIMCQVCHIPYKTYWTFRFFNDLVGYSNQFDNRFQKFTVENGTVTMYQFPGEWAIPAFSPSPTYGVNYSFTIIQTDDNGNDIIVPMNQIDMDPYRALIRWNDNGTNFGMWKIQSPFFPWRWAPVIVKRHTVDDAGNDVVKAGLINPVTVATWMDATTGKVLFIRELNAAVEGLAYGADGNPLGRSTVDPENPEKAVPAITMVQKSQAEQDTGKPAVSTKDANGNDTGMVAAVKLIKIKGEDKNRYIYDNDGDMIPEIDSDYEYESMKLALKQVLDEEDPEHEHDPVIFLGIAPFGIDHGVLPKPYSLGYQDTLSCKACHNSDESKNRLSEAVMAGNKEAGRFITLVPFALPEKAIEESKAKGGWHVPEGVKTVKLSDGREIMGLTQGAMYQFTSVPVESKEYAGAFLITPDGNISGPESEEVKIIVEPEAVRVPTILKVEKVESPNIEDSAVDSAEEMGIQNPVLASEIVNIEAKVESFEKPITFRLKYDPTKVRDKVAVLVSEDGKNWSKLAEFPVDPENPYVSFTRSYFSYFAVVGPGSSSEVASGISGSGGGGGCSLAEVPTSTGTVNLGVILSGLLGLLGYRRKKS